MSKSKKELKKLIIPIYLDTNLLIDLLASLEDGFSMMQEVKTVNDIESSSNSSANIKTGLGFPSIFQLFELGASGETENKKNNSEEHTQTKYHSFGSLLFNLLTKLNNDGYLNNDFNNLQVGDFIEIEGNVSLNPLLNSFDKLIKFAEGTELINNVSDFSNSNKNQNANMKAVVQIRTKMIEFQKGLTKDGQKHLFLTNNELSVLFNVFDRFLRDLAGLEINNSRLTLLAKVVSIESNVNLLEGSSIEAFGDNIIKPLSSAFAQMGKSFKIPKLRSKVKGKVIRVLPIAIYS